MIYSVNFPITHTLPSPDAGFVEYEIEDTLTGEVIYKGRAYAMPGDEEITIDISAVVSDHVGVESYMPGYHENNLIEGERAVRRISLLVSGEDEATYDVAYDYSDQAEYPTWYMTSEYVFDRVCPGQLLPVSVNMAQTQLSLLVQSSLSLNGRGLDNTQISSSALILYDLDRFGIAEGDMLSLFVGNVVGSGDTLDFKAEEAPYVLYYINRKGGMDFIPCPGKSTVSYSYKCTDMKKRFDRRNPADFHTTRLSSVKQKKYTLNTPLLDDAKSRLMEDLFESPRVWLHDMENGDIVSVIVSDNSHTVKTFANNRMFSSTIRVEESRSTVRK